MKVSAIQVNYNLGNIRDKKNFLLQNNKNISFGIANAGKLKILFSYGLPCMYSGVEMIDPRRAQKFIKANTFKQPVSKVIQALAPFENQITKTEKIVYNIIKKEAVSYPDLTLQQLLQHISPIYRKQLRKKQAPIFSLLNDLGEKLPDDKRYKFKQLMDETTLKLQRKPVAIPFSANEFRYKLKKIKEDAYKSRDFQTMKFVNKVLKESQRFYWETNDKTLEHQKKLIEYFKLILSRTNLKNDESIKELLNTSQDRILKKKSVIPFSRKAFIYDLTKLLMGVQDAQLKETMLGLAKLLPTSRESAQAYIIKFSTQPSEKIGYRLLWPNFASVEHILPKSCGGKDEMANFGGATTSENSERKNIDFISQIRRRPQTGLFCQKYIDKLIQYFQNGIFAKHNIDPQYIIDFKNTIKKQSKGLIVLNTDNLNL